MIRIEVPDLAKLAEYFGRVPGSIDEAVYIKLQDLTSLLHAKVIENLSGKVLKVKTGELRDSIRQDIRREESRMVGTVGPVPESVKAFVQEFGGTKSYEILPLKARALHFIAKSGDEVFARRVWHPPLEERSYLRSALAEIGDIYEAEFSLAIEEGLAY